MYSLGGAGGIGISSYTTGVGTSSIFSGISGIKYKGGDGTIVYNSTILNNKPYYNSTIKVNGGGGGGGGYYGGGGGGQGISSLTTIQIAGGGGGGSSYIDNLVSATYYDGSQSDMYMLENGYKNNAGLQNNNGLVILSYKINLNLEYTDSKTSIIVRESSYPVAGWVAGNYSSGSNPVNSIIYSLDGLQWNTVLQGGFTDGNYTYTNSVYYGQNLWGAVGPTVNNISTASIQTSLDGVIWNNINNGGFLWLGNGITYNKSLSLWIATGKTNTQNGSIQYSRDGINFNNIATGGFSLLGVSSIGNAVTCSLHGTSVAVGVGNTRQNSIQYSLDGIIWSSANSGGFDPNTQNLSIGNGVATNEIAWVAVGKASSGEYQSTIQYSIDGSNWSFVQTGGFATTGHGVAYGNGKWVAVGDVVTNGDPKNTIQYSIDGSNWNSANSGGFAYYGYSIAFNGKFWIAGGSTDNANENFQYSTDASNWTPSSNLPTNLVNVLSVSPGFIIEQQNMITSIKNNVIETNNIITSNTYTNNLYVNNISSGSINIGNVYISSFVCMYVCM